MIVVTSSIGFAFSIFGVSVCRFAIVVFPLDAASRIGLKGEIGLGLFNRQGTGAYWAYLDDVVNSSNVFPFECISYKNGERDNIFGASWKASIAMAVITTILGTVAMIASFSVTCRSHERFFFKILGVLLIACAFFGTLSFLWFTTELCSTYDCHYSIAAGSMTGACLMFAIAGVCSMLVLPTPKLPKKAPVVTSLTKSTNLDGAIIRPRAALHEDKSTTVEDGMTQVIGAKSSIAPSKGSNEIPPKMSDQCLFTTEEETESENSGFRHK